MSPDRKKVLEVRPPPDEVEDKCIMCEKTFSMKEMNESGVWMLQSTECFHQIHTACLIELVFK